MKRILIYASVLLILIIAILPFITGNLEKEELNAETRAKLEGSFIKLTDGYTHYQIDGSEDAKTIVLIHGNAAPYISWDNNYNALVNEGFRLLRYDLYGHGYSDRPKHKVYNRDLYDRQLSELIEALGIKEPIYLVGTSQGGSICAYYVAQHPEKVEKIALLAPLFDEFEGKRNAELMKSKYFGEYLMSVIGDKMLTNPSGVLSSEEKKEELSAKLKEQFYYKGKKRAVLANMRGDAISDATVYYEQIKKQGIPVLLTWGVNDRSIPEASMERLCELIPEVQYHEIRNASHLAHYEFPEEINPLLINFFVSKTK